jgi:hypothetical protein
MGIATQTLPQHTTTRKRSHMGRAAVDSSAPTARHCRRRRSRVGLARVDSNRRTLPQLAVAGGDKSHVEPAEVDSSAPDARCCQRRRSRQGPASPRKPYFFLSQRTVFFSHNTSVNRTFSHDFSAMRTGRVGTRAIP